MWNIRGVYNELVLHRLHGLDGFTRDEGEEAEMKHGALLAETVRGKLNGQATPSITLIIFLLASTIDSQCSTIS